MPRNWRTKLSSGSSIILLTCVILLGISGCSLIRPTNQYQVVIPEIPILDNVPRMDLGAVVIDFEDWQKIRRWFKELERELRAACIANGQSEGECSGN